MKDYPKISGLLFIAASFIIFLSLISYDIKDISFLSYPSNKPFVNLIGIAGAYMAFFFFFILGYGAFLIPFFLSFKGLSRLNLLRFKGIADTKLGEFIGTILVFFSLPVILGLFLGNNQPEEIFKTTGVFGYFIINFFKKYLGITGSMIVFVSLFTIGSILTLSYLIIDVMIFLRKFILYGVHFIKNVYLNYQNYIRERRSIKKEQKRAKIRMLKMDSAVNGQKKIGLKSKPEIKIYTPSLSSNQNEVSSSASKTIEIEKQKTSSSQKIREKLNEIEKSPKEAYDINRYKLPSINILKIPPPIDYRQAKENIQANIKNLEETLSEFGVIAKVVSVQKGPVVTRYELQPQPGIKIQKITSLADDIALAMKTSQVRVVAPIPGRGTIGVEVPNFKSHIVRLREVLEDRKFVFSPSKITLALGKDVAGNPVVADLKEMPHLLIAGTTGSGKTVCVNSIIVSILFKAKPNEVKLLLVDPKMVELAPFAGIPHLIHPLISDPKKVFAALNWCVEEMERRYQHLAEEGCRNIDVYNKKGWRMPYIVVIIDELADLMAVSRDNIESAIQRLAQLSRAVGIHLILATQRPSVDVITGVIKANFPARISFKVSSKVDSRTVLDMIGAEKLLGRGDMLFFKQGLVKPIRAQGSYIEDDDIERLVEFLRSQGGPVYEEGILKSQKSSEIHLERDELFDEAVKIILQTRQASASLLQRRLRIGYTRAARLLDLMEQEGIVGPFQGSKAREILVNPEEYLKKEFMDDKI